MGKAQSGSVFVFDEPTIGLHPLDVQTLLTVFQTLIESGATVIVIEHDLDVIRSADIFSIWAPAAVKRAVGLSPAALRNRSKTPQTA